MTPHLVTVIVMQQAFCPEGAVKEKVCRFISAADVNGLFKNPTVIVPAEARLKACYDILENTEFGGTRCM